MNFMTSKSLEILYFLLFNPMEQFHGREIARQTGISVGAVNQFLRKFHEIGLVGMDRRGKTDLYRANLRNAATRKFEVLFNVLALSDLINDVKESSDRIKLFGSCAEEVDVKDNDIDLFILTSSPEDVQSEVRRHGQTMDRRISPIVVDSNELAKMKIKDKPLYERTSRGMTLWERE
jgi:predicted nucleotidyltransferase